MNFFSMYNIEIIRCEWKAKLYLIFVNLKHPVQNNNILPAQCEKNVIFTSNLKALTYEKIDYYFTSEKWMPIKH